MRVAQRRVVRLILTALVILGVLLAAGGGAHPYVARARPLAQRGVQPCVAPFLAGPTAGSVLSSLTVTFQWGGITDPDCLLTGYDVEVRTVESPGTGGVLVMEAQNVSGSSVTRTLASQWLDTDLYWTARAANSPSGAAWAGPARFRIVTRAKAAITAPSPGSQLSGGSVQFHWTAGVGATGYRIVAGPSDGASTYFNSGAITATSATVTGLPRDGSTIYVRLTTIFPSGEEFTTYQYTAAVLTAMYPQDVWTSDGGADPWVRKTAFYQGQSITYVALLNNPGDRADTVMLHWSVSGPGGTIYALSEQVMLNPGQTRRASPVRALAATLTTGNYTLAVTLTQGSQSATRTASFSVTMGIVIDDAWTNDGGDDWAGRKTLFNPGDPIRYVAAVNNHTGAARDVEFVVSVSDPGGVIHFSHDPRTTGAGIWWWGLTTAVPSQPVAVRAGERPREVSIAGRLPQDIAAGAYTLSFSVIYSGLTSTRQAGFTIGATPCAAPALNEPADGATFTNHQVTFRWAAVTGCAFEGYTFRVKTVPNMDAGGVTIVNTNSATTEYTHTFATDRDNQDLYWGVRAANAPADSAWNVRRFRLYTESRAEMLTPVPGTRLPRPAVTFTWTAAPAAQLYALWIGNSPGSANYFDSGTPNTSLAVTSLPEDGSTVHVTLWTLLPSGWQANAYQYLAALPVTNCSAGWWRAEYFDNISLTGGASWGGCEAAINYDWGYTGPAGKGVGGDIFSVRWWKIAAYTAGPYRLLACADDGIRVLVNGVLKIDAWVVQGYTCYTHLLTLTADAHVVIVEYYQNTGAARVAVSLTAEELPPTPGNRRILSTTANSATLGWDDVATETAYRIVWAVAGSSTYTFVDLPAGATSWPHTGLVAGQTYYHWLAACNAAGCSPWASFPDVTPGGTPPVPAGLRVGAPSAGVIPILWDDVAGETAFQVAWTQAGSGSYQFVSLGANTTTWTHSALPAGQSNFYHVRACNGANCSDWSSGIGASASPFPTLPAGLRAGTVTDTAIEILWDDVAGETVYRIAWTTQSPIGYQFPQVAGTTWTATGLSTGMTYYFHVAACAGLNCTNWSGGIAVEARTPPPVPWRLRTGLVTANTVELRWDDVAGETSYRIAATRLSPISYSFTTVGANSTAQWFTGLPASTGYLYYVQSCAGTSCSNWAGPLAVDTRGGTDWIVELRWNGTPHDLDSHLWLPAGDPFHVSFGQRGSLTSFPHAWMAQDSSGTSGPEVTTITTLYDSGSYIFAVYNYSGTPDLAGTGATVNLYRGGELRRSYTVPAGGSGRWWEVFRLDGPEEVTDVNALRETSPAPYGPERQEAPPKPARSPERPAATPRGVVPPPVRPGPVRELVIPAPPRTPSDLVRGGSGVREVALPLPPANAPPPAPAPVRPSAPPPPAVPPRPGGTTPSRR